jgi:hypothetical protein
MMTVAALFLCWWTEPNKANHAERQLSVEEFQFTFNMHMREMSEFVKKNPADSATTSHRHQRETGCRSIDGSFHAT